MTEKDITYQGLKDKATATRLLAERFEAEAEIAKADEVKRAGIAGWRGYAFKSSSGLTPEWTAFSADMRRNLKRRLTGYTLLAYNREHFYFSAFAKNEQTGKLVYISCNDVRFFPDAWNSNLLIRTAKHDKDYTGGSNCYTSLENLKATADNLTA
jgi:hypothetical protein